MEVMRATWLTAEQLKECEWAVHQLPEPDEHRRAVQWWVDYGRVQSIANRQSNNIRLDDAVVAFRAYLEKAVDLRDATRRNLRYRVAMFVSEVGNLPLSEITPECVESWLGSRKTSAVTKDNDRRALARFFTWCTQRPQRFIVSNPCREIRVAKPEREAPEIYPMRKALRILAAARRFRKGRFLKFVVLTLFGGLRPTEALRFRDEQLVDGHFRVEGRQSKTGEARTIEADPVLLAWLKVAGEGNASDPQKAKPLWKRFKAKAKIEDWIHDGLRHTAISHYFRRCGSYGLTAEWAGNSEATIKAHYAARTTTAESAAYWSLFPDRKSRRKSRGGDAGVVQFPVSAKAVKKAGAR